METTNNLKALLALGQSPWYDNIDRRIIENGKMEDLFAQGITGVTSNPSIFEKAVNGSAIYDSSIRELADAGQTPDEICNLITIQDIQSAADMLSNIYRESGGRDGYVSLEVNPDYADAWFNWGSVLLATGRTRDGVDKLERAARLNPSLRPAVERLRSAIPAESPRP